MGPKNSMTESYIDNDEYFVEKAPFHSHIPIKKNICFKNDKSLRSKIGSSSSDYNKNLELNQQFETFMKISQSRGSAVSKESLKVDKPENSIANKVSDKMNFKNDSYFDSLSLDETKIIIHKKTLDSKTDICETNRFVHIRTTHENRNALKQKDELRRSKEDDKYLNRIIDAEKNNINILNESHEFSKKRDGDLLVEYPALFVEATELMVNTNKKLLEKCLIYRLSGQLPMYCFRSEDELDFNKCMLYSMKIPLQMNN